MNYHPWLNEIPSIKVYMFIDILNCNEIEYKLNNTKQKQHNNNKKNPLDMHELWTSLEGNALIEGALYFFKEV